MTGSDRFRPPAVSIPIVPGLYEPIATSARSLDSIESSHREVAIPAGSPGEFDALEWALEVVELRVRVWLSASNHGWREHRDLLAPTSGRSKRSMIRLNAGLHLGVEVFDVVEIPVAVRVTSLL